jgi:hypothetical protein
MFQKIFNSLPIWFKSLPYSDKILHALIGLQVYIDACLIMTVEIAFIPLFLVGAIKEIYDNQKKGNFASLGDFFATMSLPFILYVIFKVIF